MIANLSTRLAGWSFAGCSFAGRSFAGTRLAMAALLALIVAGTAVPAAAQNAASPGATPQVSSGALLLAKQIVQIKSVDDVFKPIVAGVVQKAREMFLQTNFMYQKDIDEVAFSVGKQFAPRVSEVDDAAAHYYASHFSEQELRDLLNFYQSPLGKKALAEEPKILDESMIFAGTWAENLSQDVIRAMRVELKRRGHDM
jgi:uncharacterized protein